MRRSAPAFIYKTIFTYKSWDSENNIIVYLALLIYYNRQNTSTLGILSHFWHFFENYINT